MKVIKDETGVYMELPRDKIKFVSKEIDRMIGKIQYIKKIMSKVEDYNE